MEDASIGRHRLKFGLMHGKNRICAAAHVARHSKFCTEVTLACTDVPMYVHMNSRSLSESLIE